MRRDEPNPHFYLDGVLIAILVAVVGKIAIEAVQWWLA